MARKRIYKDHAERQHAYIQRCKTKAEKRLEEIEKEAEAKPQSLPPPVSNPQCPVNNHCLSEDYHCSLGKDWYRCKYYLWHTKQKPLPERAIGGYTPNCFHSDQDNVRINNDREKRNYRSM